VDYELFAYEGNAPDKKESLNKRSETIELKTSSSSSPRSASSVIPPMDCNITWLLQHLNEGATLEFSIDRVGKACKTPTRNPEVDASLIYFTEFHSWATKVENYIRNQLFPVQTSYTSMPTYEIHKISDASVFVPVLPLFERPDQTKIALKDKLSAAPGSNLGVLQKYDNSSPVLSIGDINLFLTYEMTSLQANFADLAKTFPSGKGYSLIYVFLF